MFQRRCIASIGRFLLDPSCQGRNFGLDLFGFFRLATVVVAASAIVSWWLWLVVAVTIIRWHGVNDDNDGIDTYMDNEVSGSIIVNNSLNFLDDVVRK